MYSGQVSVTEEQLVPLVQAAKELGIKGLVDVPVQDRVKSGGGETKLAASPPSPPPPVVRKQTVRPRPSPVTRPVEVEVKQRLPASSEPEQEEGVDPSGSEMDQSVSIGWPDTGPVLIGNYISSNYSGDSPAR